MRRKAASKSVVYQSPNGALELKRDVQKDTIWATQAQIAQMFEVDRSVVTKHIGNIFRNGEVEEKSNVQKMHIAKADRPVAYYSLDIILSVGYRTSSARAIAFRQWATKILREHIISGYTINRKRIAKNYDSFIKAVDAVRALLPANSKIETADILELIKTFADTWFSLNAYDNGQFISGRVTRKRVTIVAGELVNAISKLKNHLICKGEASDLFALERAGSSLSGIVGNVMQTFGRKDLYPSLEEKAANLLYFVVKDHPFVDGNKRSGAFAFIWFLRCAKLLDLKRFTPTALTTLTLLIAESHPNDKDKMIGLVMMLLGQ